MRQNDASLCSYLALRKVSEPTTSINTYFRWSSAADFTVKHCTPSQLFAQQLTHNPAYML